MHFLDIPGVTGRRTKAPIKGAEENPPLGATFNERYPRWISKQDQVAETIIRIGDKTQVTQVQFNQWSGDEIAFIGRDHELYEYSDESLIIPKRKLVWDLQIALMGR